MAVSLMASMIALGHPLTPAARIGFQKYDSISLIFLFFTDTTQAIYLAKQNLTSLADSHLVAYYLVHKPKLRPLSPLIDIISPALHFLA